MRPPSSGRKWVWRAAAFCLAAVQLPVLYRTGADPSQSDFANYFAPARVLARGGAMGSLYDRDAFAIAMSEAGISGLGSFVPHPPANALWLLPLASLSAGVAKGVWSAVLVGALFLTLLALGRLREGPGPWEASVIVLAPTLAIRNGLAFGQPYLILAALLACGALAIERGRGFMGGVLLGLGVSFKPYALGLAFLFLRREARPALAGFVCGALLPSVLLWTLAGFDPFVAFGTRVLPWMLRGEIQDPFSPAWGSVHALANRLFRFEPDLNPHPWLNAPLAARLTGAAIAATLAALGIFAGRRAAEAGQTAKAVGIVIAFALAASPFSASYHLVLLALPVALTAARPRERADGRVILFWAIVGSSVVNLFRGTEGAFAPLGFARLFGIVAIALLAARGFVSRRVIGLALLVGGVVGGLALRFEGGLEAWSRIDAARGYSMMKPHFCGPALHWLAPSADGRRLEPRGEGPPCPESSERLVAEGGARVSSRFAAGSWDLYLTWPEGREVRLTHSRANEIDPVVSPGGCGVVFASDQGRGLGSTALYRLDLTPFIEACGGPGPDGGPS